MIFRCRTLRPELSEWFEIEEETADRAANEFHVQKSDYFKNLSYWMPTEDGGQEVIHFAMIEVEGHKPVISRYYYRGIYRKGGVRPNQPTLVQIAEQLHWKADPKELIEPWEGEETWGEARAKRYK